MRPEVSNTPTQSIAGIPIASSSSGIAIEFTNESQKTADLVNFAVDSNGENFVIRDVGTFSPGVSIKHEYRNGSGQAFVLPAFIAPHVNCRVASVKFTDGTVWRHDQGSSPAEQTTPNPSNAVAAPLSANPSQLNLERTTDAELFMVSSVHRVAAYKETDDCAGVATVFVAATGISSATYSVKPLGAGQCTARIVDEAGHTLAVPVTVRG
ncbi:MAG: hypothetical protein M3R44_01830 [Candidatus Eremiobacteraeota bacterium]|nr:hypothetical protein [Candidatus Eremiobacteraeota bacterium]